RLADQNCNLSREPPLIILQLLKPGFAEYFGALGFPYDGSTHAPRSAHHLLYNVSATEPFWDRLDLVHRKGAAKEFLQLKLKHLSLRLLRALFKFTFQFVVRLFSILDLFFLFGEPQLVLLIGAPCRLLLDLLSLRIYFPRGFEVEIFRSFIQFAGALARFKLSLLRRVPLRCGLGELIFQVLYFDLERSSRFFLHLFLDPRGFGRDALLHSGI